MASVFLVLFYNLRQIKTFLWFWKGGLYINDIEIGIPRELTVLWKKKRLHFSKQYLLFERLGKAYVRKKKKKFPWVAWISFESWHFSVKRHANVSFSFYSCTRIQYSPFVLGVLIDICFPETGRLYKLNTPWSRPEDMFYVG